MFALLLLASIDTELTARVSADLAEVEVLVRTTLSAPEDETVLVLAADRYRQLPPGFTSARERELFRGGYDFGGLDLGTVFIDGKPCAPRIETLPDGARLATCPKGQLVEVTARLRVPERYGAFGRHAGQLVLAGAWYPYVRSTERRRHTLKLTLPPGYRAIENLPEESMTVPLLVVPPNVKPRAIDGGRAWLYTRDHESRESQELVRSMRAALVFMEEEGGPLPTKERPWVVLTHALRHELAVPTEAVTIASDIAFRMAPVERFLRFHRFPLIRAVYTSALLGREGPRSAGGPGKLGFAEPGPEVRPTSEATAAWLADRYVRSRHGKAEDAFDVLGFWSFIPAVDLLLYAPDVPFETAYFRKVDETDPLTPNLLDYPSPYGHGRVIFEKLLDRIGQQRTDEVFAQILRGETLEKAISVHLAEGTGPFLDAWLRPHPSVRYRIKAWSFDQGTARIEIEREGEVVAEPLSVLLEDEDGKERIVWSETTTAAVRVVTATLAAPLEYAELDPLSRVIETPTEQTPSPRFDNRSHAKWKVLLNNWNIAVGATGGTLDTALDVGFQKEYDVRLRYAVRADYDPGAIGVSTRSTYSFGKNVTRSRLLQSVGAQIEGAYLRPEFGETTESAFAFAGRLTYNFDDRQTLWAAEPGTSMSAALDYSHVFGQVREELEGGGSREVSADALALSLRYVRGFRFDGAHQLTFRATAGAFLLGDPRAQILFRAGGRSNLRGYEVDAVLSEVRAIGSVEWQHPLLPEVSENGFFLWWVTGMDGAFYADAAIVADELSALDRAVFLADVGYGVRLYLQYFGVRPGVMSVDLAFPLFDVRGRRDLGPPAVYIDFSQSF
jgi:hypothetical protein